MGHGGARRGAGRKRRNPAPSTEKLDTSLSSVTVAPAVADLIEKHGQSPLEYMLKVVNNPEADQGRRDRLAIAAAPFCHPRIADNRFGKGDEKAVKAEEASAGKFAPPSPPKLIVDNG
jgi:hypothetical protein